MGYGRCVGRVGALAVATRMTVSIGVAVLVVMATAVPAPTVSPAVRLSAAVTTDSTALILGGTSVPTPDDAYIEAVKNQFIAPTHPGQDIEYVAVTAPEEAWPVTGLVRLVWLVLGPPSVCGPGGPAWPDEPWWKLSGLFDLTFDQSVQAGVADLEAGDGRARQRPSGDLRLLAGRGHRERGEAQARRAVPGGNQSPRHRLRVER